jgi:hypothetical protein
LHRGRVHHHVCCINQLLKISQAHEIWGFTYALICTVQQTFQQLRFVVGFTNSSRILEGL